MKVQYREKCALKVSSPIGVIEFDENGIADVPEDLIAGFEKSPLFAILPEESAPKKKADKPEKKDKPKKEKQVQIGLSMDKPEADKPTDEKAADEKPSEDKPVEEKPTEPSPIANPAPVGEPDDIM